MVSNLSTSRNCQSPGALDGATADRGLIESVDFAREFAEILAVRQGFEFEN